MNDRYFGNSNYNSQTENLNKKPYDKSLCNDCQNEVAVRKFIGIQLCQHCKNIRMDNESKGEKYDRYISMGLTDEEAQLDSGYRH